MPRRVFNEQTHFKVNDVFKHELSDEVPRPEMPENKISIPHTDTAER